MWTICFVCVPFCSREILDHQDGNIEDDGLTGLLRLATSVIKHKPPFKFSREGQVGIKKFKCLYEIWLNIYCWIYVAILNFLKHANIKLARVLLWVGKVEHWIKYKC